MRHRWAVLILFAAACLPIHVPQPARDFNAQCAERLSAGALVEAKVLCEHALEYQPRYWDALNNLGLIHHARGETAAARRCFLDALHAFPDLAQASNNLAVLALEAGHPKEALGYLEHALRVNPEYLEARDNQGLAYLALHDLDAAENAWRHQLVSAPQLASAHANLGAVELERQHPAEAAAWFEKAVLLDPRFARAWKGLGAARARLGLHEAAREAFTACLDEAPEDLECRDALQALAGN